MAQCDKQGLGRGGGLDADAYRRLKDLKGTVEELESGMRKQLATLRRDHEEK
jgi:hypothetical protein